MIKFRCSRLGDVMTDPRAKKDLLSKTTETYVRQIYLGDTYGRRRDIYTKEMRKGIDCEDNSIELVNSVLGTFFSKNEDFFENEYIRGTPDILFADAVIDIKTSWDLFTFTEAEMSPAYMWQLMGYMWLTGKTIGYIAYCLVDTPEELIMDELRSKSWQLGYISDESPEYREMEQQVRLNMTFDDIDENRRVKFFRVEFDQVYIDRLIERIGHCRDYYNSLSAEPNLDVRFEAGDSAMEEDIVVEGLIVSGVHQVALDELFTKGKAVEPIEFARHQHRALALSRGLSLTQVAKEIGVTHSSVNNSAKVHKNMLETDSNYLKLWEDVRRKHNEWIGSKAF